MTKLTDRTFRYSTSAESSQPGDCGPSNRWTPVTPSGDGYWLCRCACGTEREVYLRSIIKGMSKSCGCHKRERAQAKAMPAVIRRTKQIWKGMIQRCGTPTNTAYWAYGARGIKVCPRWLASFDNFRADMGERPHGMSLDRIDTTGNYGPENCRWATKLQQANNTRTNRSLTIGCETRTLAEWCRVLGISYEKNRKRMTKPGWTLAQVRS